MALLTHTRSKTGGCDWITPKRIIETLGPFDFDPCASEAQPWDTAEKMISPPYNGLLEDWTGFVWMNPPYGKKTERWTARMAEHSRGIMLVFARVETGWFWRDVWGRASGIYFIKGRIKFHYPDGREAINNSGGPSCLVAYGGDALERLRVFQDPMRVLPGTLVDYWDRS